MLKQRNLSLLICRIFSGMIAIILGIFHSYYQNNLEHLLRAALIPTVATLMVMIPLTELLVGMCLFAGFLTRWTSGLSCVIAFFLISLKWVVSSIPLDQLPDSLTQDPFTLPFSVLIVFFLSCLYTAIMGGGKWSIDSKIKRKEKEDQERRKDFLKK